MRKQQLSNKIGEVRELTQKDIRAMKPAEEILPNDLLRVLPRRKVGQRGPQKQPTKISITSRYSQEVVDYFRATGKGWQVRMDKALKEWIHKNSN